MDIGETLGPVEVVPGSHKQGLLTTEVVHGFGKVDRYDDGSFRLTEARQGDAIFFSAFMVHRSGTNSTESIRWSCHFRYNNLRERTFIDRGYPHPYIYRPQEELITPEFPSQEMLGEIFGEDAPGGTSSG